MNTVLCVGTPNICSYTAYEAWVLQIWRRTLTGYSVGTGTAMGTSNKYPVLCTRWAFIHKVYSIHGGLSLSAQSLSYPPPPHFLLPSKKSRSQVRPPSLTLPVSPPNRMSSCTHRCMDASVASSSHSQHFSSDGEFFFTFFKFLHDDQYQIFTF